jgi:hypothetical protein
LRIDGLVQIHGITLLLVYGDDLSVSSEINGVVMIHATVLRARKWVLHAQRQKDIWQELSGVWWDSCM